MSQIRRVTIVTETFYPEINGVANTLGFLVEGLKKQGIFVQIIRPKQNKQDRFRNSSNSQLVTVPGLPIPGYKQLKFGLPFSRTIKRALTNFDSDAVYIATEGPLGLATLRAAKKLNLPILSGFHTNFHQYFEHYHLAFLKRLVFKYLRAFHNGTARTLVPTHDLKDDLYREGFKNVHVLARGVDSQLFTPEKRVDSLRDAWGVSQCDPVLLYVGRIASEKNVLLALKCFESFKVFQPKAQMVLVGDGPMRSQLESQYPGALFVGEQRGEDLARYYASADVFLFPSLTDTYGNVVLEAMASGLHVLAFNYAAAGTLIEHSVNGTLAGYRDELDYLDKVNVIAKSWQANEALRTKARETSEQLSWQLISENFFKQFQIIKEERSNGTNQESVFISKI